MRKKLDIRRLHRTAAGLLATAILAICGVVMTAGQASAATTYWTYQSQYNGNCLTAAAASDGVFTTTCQGWQSQDWDWIGSANIYGQHQLKSRTRGLCLTTDAKSDRNAVWLSSCNGGQGQYWDNDFPPYLYADGDFWLNSLRISPESDAVYTSDAQNDWNVYGIPYSTHHWNANSHQ